MLLNLLAITTIAFYLAFIIETRRGFGKSYRLTDFAPDHRLQWPRVSIIVAARNEAEKIAEGVGSLLTIDYPDLEVIVVNDRSTDTTGEIVGELAQRDQRLRIVTIHELPKGWMGKNWALHSAAAGATGDYLLFSDADVIFEPSALRRAVTFMEAEKVDHLACAPRITGGTVPLRLFVASFAVFFSMYARPWKARDPKSKAHVGVGAFNLVRTSLYRAVGGHATIAMRPDDDVKLGKILKSNGGRAAFLSAQELVTVEWYSTLRQAIHGLEKNSFSGVEYSYLLLVAASIAQMLLNIWPVIAIVVTTGVTQWLNIAATATMMGVAAIYAHRSGFSALFGLTFPLATLLFNYILWNAALKNGLEGGVRWRGTFYSLEELRANKV